MSRALDQQPLNKNPATSAPRPLRFSERRRRRRRRLSSPVQHTHTKKHSKKNVQRVLRHFCNARAHADKAHAHRLSRIAVATVSRSRPRPSARVLSPAPHRTAARCIAILRRPQSGPVDSVISSSGLVSSAHLVRRSRPARTSHQRTSIASNLDYQCQVPTHTNTDHTHTRITRPPQPRTRPPHHTFNQKPECCAHATAVCVCVLDRTLGLASSHKHTLSPHLSPVLV